MVKSAKVTANRPNQSLNEPLTVPKRRKRTHHLSRSNLLMTTWMSTLVQVRARTVKKLQMSHQQRLQRSQQKQNQKMILMVPVTEGGIDHPSQNRNNLHDMLKVLATERFTDHLGAQLVKVHLGLPPNQSNLHDKQ